MYLVALKNQNIVKYDENKHRITGVGKAGDVVFIEYVNHADERKLIKVHPSRIVEHTCLAAEKGSYSRTGCWHLAAAADVLGLKMGSEVSVKISDPLAGPIETDLTPEYFGRQGDFKLLTLKAPETAPEEAPEAEGTDIFSRYRIPAGLVEKIKAFCERQKARLTEEQRTRVPKEALYVATGKEVARAVASLLQEPWEAPLLVGPRGTGKSTMAETVAHLLNLPVRKIFGGIDLNAESLLGSKTLQPVEGIDFVTETKLRVAARKAGIDPEPLVSKLRGAQMKVAFEPGILLQAVQDGELLVIDEVNMLSPEVTSLLHGLLDWQKTLTVPGYGMVQAPPDFRVISCMNPGYAGTKALNEAFQDRFRSIRLEYPPKEHLQALIPGDRAVAEKLAEIFLAVAARVKNGDISERAVSFRAVLRAAKEYQAGLGSLKECLVSSLTEHLDDQFEASQVTDLIEARIA